MTDFYEILGISRSLKGKRLKDELDRQETRWKAEENSGSPVALGMLAVISQAKKSLREGDLDNGVGDDVDLDRPDSAKPEESVTTHHKTEEDYRASTEDRDDDMLVHGGTVQGKHQRIVTPINRGTCIFSFVCIILAVLGALFWIVMMFIGLSIGELTEDTIDPSSVIIWTSVSFGFFFLLGGFPWGWRLLGDVKATILAPLLVVLCYALGWINMLIHIPDIFRSLRRRHTKKGEDHVSKVKVK